jgi:hypothetical protein
MDGTKDGFLKINVDGAQAKLWEEGHGQQYVEMELGFTKDLVL